MPGRTWLLRAGVLVCVRGCRHARFPPARRGLAVGVSGMGMVGTAISALTTVKLVTAHGIAAPFMITACALAAFAVVAALVLRDAPGRTVPSGTLGSRLAATARLGSAGKPARCTRSRSADTSRSLSTCPPTSKRLAQADTSAFVPVDLDLHGLPFAGNSVPVSGVATLDGDLVGDVLRVVPDAPDEAGPAARQPRQSEEVDARLA